MIDDAIAERGDLLDPVVARHLLSTLGLPIDPVNLLQVRRASGARVRLGGAAPGGSNLPDDGRMLAALGVLPPAASKIAFTEGEPACEWLGEHLPRAVRPGEEFLANLRFRNVGTVPMLAAGDRRVNLAATWYDSHWTQLSANGQDDDPARSSHRDLRTPLPADLPPGGMLTVAVRLHAPTEPGQYSLVLKMVQEGVRWLEPSYGPFAIHVQPNAGFVPPASWVLDGPGAHEPAADRDRATTMMIDWVATHAGEQPRVLELGSGMNPVTARLPSPGYQVDGDLLALQLGAMTRRKAGASVLSFCAAFNDLPFPEAYFDAIVCFNTLHYVPDLVATLGTLRGHLRRGGFIGLFCEPVGQMWPGAPGAKLLAELRQGLNPQGFSLAEYARIFALARLTVAELVIDGVSMKVRLTPEGADV
ncbi:methyltransferase domain-containing protein [Acidisphaera sp. L21]|uniref:methyltransferase domain-containing protein n=1 Tax=Acidisphaera sp. L21 TaxID=1641851 RepID=UPI00131D6CC7|nr:methyltransferase domain-containing protein [Acidisphaera sp. L21]